MSQISGTAGVKFSFNAIFFIFWLEFEIEFFKPLLQVLWLVTLLKIY